MDIKITDIKKKPKIIGPHEHEPMGWPELSISRGAGEKVRICKICRCLYLLEEVKNG